MRTIEEIKADIAWRTANGTQKECDAAWLEWFRVVANGIHPDRLEEICNAEREGRCVVLPCKAGDIVCVSVKNWDGTKCLKGNFVPHVEKRKVAALYIRDNQEPVICFGWSDLQEFGKTVFLTPEAAEAALKERDNNDN